jgi:hypothetical protein
VKVAPPATSRSGGALVAVGLIAAVVAVFGVVLLASTSYDVAAVVVLAPLLVVLSLPVLRREAARAEDRTLFWLLLVALLVKLGGAVANHYVSFDVYGGVADAAGYHLAGAEIAERFRSGIFDTGLDSLTDLNFIRLLTGIIYTIIGPSAPGGFLLFSWLSFWGLFFFYRAFALAVPEGRISSYVRLLFFLPSLIFWPSTIGKEAWMVFVLGIAALGMARLLTGRIWNGLLFAALGLWMASLVRPHMAGLMAVALVGAYLVQRRQREGATLAPVARLLGLVAVVGLAGILLARTDRFLRQVELDPGRGIVAVLRGTSELTALDRSRFTPSVLDSPARAPQAVITVLYRPTLLEAHNAQALLAAMETSFLLALTAIRWRWIVAAARSIRRQAYIAFALIYTGLFVVAFSGFANFGLLARERVQLLPLFLALLCVPPRRRDEDLDAI